MGSLQYSLGGNVPHDFTIKVNPPPKKNKVGERETIPVSDLDPRNQSVLLSDREMNGKWPLVFLHCPTSKALLCGPFSGRTKAATALRRSLHEECPKPTPSLFWWSQTIPSVESTCICCMLDCVMETYTSNGSLARCKLQLLLQNRKGTF